MGTAWDNRAGLPGFLRENGGLNPVTTTVSADADPPLAGLAGPSDGESQPDGVLHREDQPEEEADLVADQPAGVPEPPGLVLASIAAILPLYPIVIRFPAISCALEIYRGLQTVLIVSVSSRTAHRLLTASSCNAS